MAPSRRAVISTAVLVPTAGALLLATGGVAHAFSTTLKAGDRSADVKRLQIRVSGYPGYGEVLELDGVFGEHTTSAVKGFQDAYGLDETGEADSATLAKIEELEDEDGTPIHFDYVELNSCNGDWSGGAVDADTAKSNALITMWKLTALRRALGDEPITISSGFRSHSCNDSVGGAPNSRHLYGDAADLVGTHSFCTLSQQARSHGFAGILGPGFPNHDDHVHVSSGDHWNAPDCGVG